MEAKGLTPILDVSDIASTAAWFEKWGWKKLWDWGRPPTFGAVGSGKEACILCQGAQGGRGRSANTTTFQQQGDEEGDNGVWMSVWVDDVDEMHKHCVAAGLEVTFPPTDMPWNVREMHLRHPDGHVFRVGRGLEGKKIELAVPAGSGSEMAMLRQLRFSALRSPPPSLSNSVSLHCVVSEKLWNVQSFPKFSMISV